MRSVSCGSVCDGCGLKSGWVGGEVGVGWVLSCESYLCVFVWWKDVPLQGD